MERGISEQSNQLPGHLPNDSYRSLNVEQIGSVYEAIMGFEVEVSQVVRSRSGP